VIPTVGRPRYVVELVRSLLDGDVARTRSSSSTTGRPTGDEAGTRPRPRGRAAGALPRRAGRGGVAGPQHRPARGPRRPRGFPGRRRGRGPDVARVRARGVGRRAGCRSGDRADPAHRAGDARPAARPGLRRLRQGLHPPHLRSRRAPSGAPALPVPGGRLRLRRERRLRPGGDHRARWLRHPARSRHAHQGRGRPRRAAAHGARRPRDRLRARRRWCATTTARTTRGCARWPTTTASA
jgi:hypothetical protein